MWKWIKKRSFAIALLVCLILGHTCNAHAAGQNFDTVQKAKLTIAYEFPQIPFEIYKIADVSETVQFTWTEDFADNKVYLEGMESAVWKKAAQALNAYVVSKGIKPDAQKVTDEEGNVCFENVETGLYLVMARSHELDGRNYEVMPVLIMLPSYTLDGKWNYELTVEAKYESVEITPAPVSVSVVKLWKDEANQSARPSEIKVCLYEDGVLREEVRLNAFNGWSYRWDNLDAASQWRVIEKNVPEHYQMQIEKEGNIFAITNVYVQPEEPSEEVKDKLPQTGQLWWPVPIVGCVGILLLICGVRRERRYYEEK